MPVDVATYLMNEKRDWLNTISRTQLPSTSCVIPNPNLQTPNYSIRRVRDDETQLAENAGISYQMVEQEELLPRRGTDTRKEAGRRRACGSYRAANSAGTGDRCRRAQRVGW